MFLTTQTNLSCPFTFHLTLEIMVIIFSSRCFSHSNLSLHQLRFQVWHRVVLLPSQLTRSLIILSLFWEIEYNLRNNSSKAWSSTYLSSQNLTHRPSPTLHWSLRSNQVPCKPLPHTRHKSFQHVDLFLRLKLTPIFL